MIEKNPNQLRSLPKSRRDFAKLYEKVVPTMEKCLESGVTFANRKELCEKGPFGTKKKTMMRSFTIPYDDNVFPQLEFKDGMDVLFIGTGYGTEMLTLINQYTSCQLNMWGVDINYDSVRLCHRQKIPATVVQATGEELPFPDNSFDIVLLREVIEHVIDPVATIREIARVGRPDCQVYVGTPNASSWALAHLVERFSMWKTGKRPKKAVTDNHYTLKEIKKIVEAADGALVLEKMVFDMPFYFSCDNLPENLSFLIPIIKRMTDFTQKAKPFDRIYCDQAKYFFRVQKPCGNSIKKKQNLGFVCPRCKSELEESVNGFRCVRCGLFYPKTNGILQFVEPIQKDDVKGIFDEPENLPAKMSPARSMKRILIQLYPVFLFGSWIVMFPLIKFSSLIRKR